MNNCMLGKLETLEGVDLILELHNLIRMKHKEIKNMSRSIINKRLNSNKKKNAYRKRRAQDQLASREDPIKEQEDNSPLRS